MDGDDRQEAYAHLMNLAANVGYITSDNILDAADRWELSITEVDRLSNSIAGRGILIYDEAPDNINKIDEDKEYNDYAQVDYESIFCRVEKLEPSLKEFINEIRLIRPAQFREMAGLKYQVKEGNEYARKRIVEMHLRVAVRIGLQRAEQYDADIVECIGDACVGLLLAVDKYDPDKHGPFGAYASLWMLQNISRVQQTHRAGLHYPAYKKEQYYMMYPILKERGCTTCERIWECKKVRKIVKDKLDCSKEQIDDVIKQVLPFDSFEELIKNDQNRLQNQHQDYFFEGVPIIYKPGSSSSISPFDQKLIQIDINAVLDSLSEREQKVIRDRYGFDYGDERTFEEISQDIGLTREGVRQIELRALRKLRRFPNIIKLKGYKEML